MALPREPRQKMINMMYLVLIAMLALNVSAEILNAFKTVNSSLENTNTTVDKSTETIMASLKEKLADPSTVERAQIWHPKADSIRKMSALLYTFIGSLKDQIMREAGYAPEKGKYDFKEDNLDIATRIMVEKESGRELYKKLLEYKSKILAVDPAISKEFKNNLPIDLSMPETQSKGTKTWEAAYFRMVPTVAALTILSKFQNDIKTTENRVIAFCHNKVGEVALRFDTYAGIVGQSSNYLMPGQELEITAGVGAFSKAAQPVITIGGANVPIGEDGAARWKTTVSTVGTHTLTVNITYTDQDGKKQTITKPVEYTVGLSNSAVALDKMNVLFIGVPNEITISGSGGAEQIQATISRGQLEKEGPGRYIARVNPPDGECEIRVTVDGKTTAHRFRVRSIPDPTPMVGQAKSGNNVQASVFKSQAGVRAVLENFFYETQFNVTSFRITGDGEGFPDLMEETNTGAAWSGRAKNIVDRVRPGSFVTIEDIRAVGPDGRTRRLPALLYNIE